MRDWQSDFKKNLQQDSIVKRIIFMTQKMEFSVKDLFNKKEQICSFMQICSHLLKKFLMEKFFFVHWFVQVDRQTTTVKKKIIYFLKNCCLFIHNFWKSPCNLQIFSTWCLDVRFWDLLYLFAWSSIHSIVIFRSSHPEMFLGKCVQFTGEHTCRSVISIKFLCKFIEITHGHMGVLL